MSTITSKEIRDIFLNYFQNKEHLIIGGASIIPENDPTLLFINSGMAPLKKYFLGEAIPPNSELCNVQPCIRTIDIDEVGDKHHLTSFQMLGSWSIDNYFKEDAISLAYELLVNHLKIQKDKLYVTVFSGDERYNLEPDKESEAIWERIGVAKDHIVYQPFEDNFWGPTAEVGPCGPCTEVFYDTEDEDGIEYVLGGEFDTKKRYIEIWNAGVFMQFNKNKDGNYDELKFKSVDTGAGLERLTMALNGYESVYDIDEIKAVINNIEEQLKFNNKTLSQKEKRVIADHMRTVVFILSEGISPSNYGRGYIPRKLIRKITTIIEKNEIKEFDFNKILELIIDLYCDFYKKFAENRDFIIREFNNEQNGFKKVVQEGFRRLNENYSIVSTEINGEYAFELVTTYGLPFELIEEYAEQKNIKVNKIEYEEKLNEHKQKSQGILKNDSNTDLQSNLKCIDEILKSYKATEFVGYENVECIAKVLGIVNRENQDIDCAKEQEECILILDKSCFYAQGGGQVADIGKITNISGLNISVLDVQKNKSGIFMHMVKINNGEIRVGDTVEMVIEKKRRDAISANHTSVHLLQSALIEVLGNGIRQMGSYVSEKRFRFDFSYDEKISKETLCQIEQIINENIQECRQLEVEEKSINDSINSGALAFFDNKYGDVVRVVNFEGISKEVCGGTHISNTGRIGVLKIISETSVAKGIRRISGVTGINAIKYIQEQEKLLDAVIEKVKANPENILTKLDSILNSKNQKNQVRAQGNVKNFKIKDNVECVISEFSEYSSEFRNLVCVEAEKVKGVAIYLCNSEKFNVIVGVDKSICNEIDARDILKVILDSCNGKGGGTSHLAAGAGSKSITVEELSNKIKNI